MLHFEQEHFAYFQNVIEWIFSKLVLENIRKVQMFL